MLGVRFCLACSPITSFHVFNSLTSSFITTSHSIAMDDEDFEDLFSENAHLLQASSQGSLIGAATNLAIQHEDDPEEPYHPQLNDDAQSEREYESLPVNTGSFAQNVLHNDFRPAVRMLPRAYPKYEPFTPDMLRKTNLTCSYSATVIDKIEAVLEEIVDAMLNDKLEIGITLKCRPRTGATRHHPKPQAQTEMPTRRFCFPGKTTDEAWRFCESLDSALQSMA